MTALTERAPPLRWTAALLRRLGLRGRALVIAVPLLWLLVFFLIPFLVVAKISLSEPAIAQPALPAGAGMGRRAGAARR